MGQAKVKRSIFEAVPTPTPAMLKLDFGCGPHKREGFLGVDCRQFDGKVDVVVNLTARKPFFTNSHDPDKPHGGGFEPWPWSDGSVAEAHASHFIEHLTGPERIHFINELYRVLAPGAKCTVITPHWGSCRAYGDLTHQWPPVSEFWFYYLSKAWRAANAPHNDGYNCDFAATWGYNMRPDLAVRAPEFQQFAFANYKEAIQDLIATLVKT